MDTFAKQVALELLKQQQMLKEQQQILHASPEGFLFPRERKNHRAYYHQHKVREGRKWKTIQTNISKDYEMQQLLLDKRLAEKTAEALQNNLPLLQQLQEHYQAVAFIDIAKQLSPRYDEILRKKELKEMQAWQSASYKRCPYYPEGLTHRTAFGDYVRSKSEAIIANALYGFGIPNHYEEELFFPDSDRPLYPDFKIRLPKGRFFYWEHNEILKRRRMCCSHPPHLIIQELHSDCNRRRRT